MVNLMQIAYISMNCMGKYIMNKPGGVDMFEFTLVRSVILATFSLVVLLVRGRRLIVERSLRKFMFIRSFAGTLTFLGACVGMRTLPISWFMLIT